MFECEPRLSSPLEQKLCGLLQGSSLNELPLDFIETVFFADVFARGEVLGAGSFGVVVRVTEIATRKDFAMKVLYVEMRIDNIEGKSEVRRNRSLS